MEDLYGKKVDEWLETVNKHKGEMKVPQLGPWPIVVESTYNWQRIEDVTRDWIRTYANAIADVNPLWWFEDYARRTRWGGIIAPPTFTDTISISWTINHEPLPEGYEIQTLPAGHKREFFGVFRPGDRVRTLDKWMGLTEIKSKEPRPFRFLIDTLEKSYINQRNETVALVTFRFAQLLSAVKPEGWDNWEGGARKRHKFTKEEIDGFYREYEENWRGGANILYWEDVAEGEETRPLVIAPFCSWDSACMLSAMPGHTGPFNLWYEKMKVQGGPREKWPVNPETNANYYGGSCHLRDGEDDPKKQGFGWNYTFEGLMSRMLTNWIGDDGFLKVLDMQSRQLPILGDAYWLKGKVVGKRIEGDEHLVDLNLHMDNQDGLVISQGKGTVRLLSRGA